MVTAVRGSASLPPPSSGLPAYSPITPHFGWHPLGQRLEDRLAMLAPPLLDKSDFKYSLVKRQLSLAERYRALPPLSQIPVRRTLFLFNIQATVTQGQQTGLTTRGEEYSDILYFLYEANVRADQGDKNYAKYPRLNIQLPDSLTKELNEIIKTKPLPSPTQYDDEINEFLDELKNVSGDDKQKIIDFFHSRAPITASALNHIEQLAHLPNYTEAPLLFFAKWKLKLRQSLQTRLPGQEHYDERKFITKPFERLLAADTFAPKSLLTYGINEIQKRWWQWRYPTDPQLRY